MAQPIPDRFVRGDYTSEFKKLPRVSGDRASESTAAPSLTRAAFHAEREFLNRRSQSTVACSPVRFFKADSIGHAAGKTKPAITSRRILRFQRIGFDCYRPSDPLDTHTPSSGLVTRRQGIGADPFNVVAAVPKRSDRGLEHFR
jgi:hypothetical protein